MDVTIECYLSIYIKTNDSLVRYINYVMVIS